MEEFLISTTLTSDLIKRYTDSIWKIVSKKFKRLKIFRIYVSILILLSWLVLGYDFYCYTVYAKTHSSLFSIVLLAIITIVAVVYLINYKYIALRKPLKILKKNIGCQIEYFFKADYIVHKSLTTGLEKELNIDEITNIVIENDMFFFLTGDKKDLACPVLIDMKQLTQEELEQVQYYISLYLYDLIYS